MLLMSTWPLLWMLASMLSSAQPLLLAQQLLSALKLSASKLSEGPGAGWGRIEHAQH